MSSARRVSYGVSLRVPLSLSASAALALGPGATGVPAFAADGTEADGASVSSDGRYAAHTGWGTRGRTSTSATATR